MLKNCTTFLLFIPCNFIYFLHAFCTRRNKSLSRETRVFLFFFHSFPSPLALFIHSGRTLDSSFIGIQSLFFIFFRRHIAQRGHIIARRSIVFFKRDAFKARARLDSRHVHDDDEKEASGVCPTFLFSISRSRQLFIPCGSTDSTYIIYFIHVYV